MALQQKGSSEQPPPAPIHHGASKKAKGREEALSGIDPCRSSMDLTRRDVDHRAAAPSVKTAEEARRFFAATRMTRTGRQTKQPKRLSYSPTTHIKRTLMATAKREAQTYSRMPSSNTTDPGAVYEGSTTTKSLGRHRPLLLSTADAPSVVRDNRSVKAWQGTVSVSSFVDTRGGRFLSCNSSNKENAAATTKKRKRPNLTVQTTMLPTTKPTRLVPHAAGCPGIKLGGTANSRPPRGPSRAPPQPQRDGARSASTALRRAQAVAGLKHLSERSIGSIATNKKQKLPKHVLPKKEESLVPETDFAGSPRIATASSLSPRPPRDRPQGGEAGRASRAAPSALTALRRAQEENAPRQLYKPLLLSDTCEPYALAAPNPIRQPPTTVFEGCPPHPSIQAAKMEGTGAEESRILHNLLRMEYAIDRGYTTRALGQGQHQVAAGQQSKPIPYAASRTTLLSEHQHFTFAAHYSSNEMPIEGFAGLTPPRLDAQNTWLTKVSAEKKTLEPATAASPSLSTRDCQAPATSFRNLPPRNNENSNEFLAGTSSDRSMSVIAPRKIAPVLISSPPNDSDPSECTSHPHQDNPSPSKTDSREDLGELTPSALEFLNVVLHSAKKKQAGEPDDGLAEEQSLKRHRVNSLEPIRIPRNFKGALAPTPLMSKSRAQQHMIPHLERRSSKPQEHFSMYPATIRSKNVT